MTIFMIILFIYLSRYTSWLCCIFSQFLEKKYTGKDCRVTQICLRQEKECVQWPYDKNCFEIAEQIIDFWFDHSHPFLRKNIICNGSTFTDMLVKNVFSEVLTKMFSWTFFSPSVLTCMFNQIIFRKQMTKAYHFM